ncbi:unnamed protein product [Notodromas monacha]|uniref:Acylphosphatase n=1 Tax=Notodromas monacha TaxID=399045 RepID=A0A7R9BD86_9CRUS|nr:unnamed protein product [Notodromas monacha]CAG0913236.1 unnamed protein product [Notodromas monacha]
MRFYSRFDYHPYCEAFTALAGFFFSAMKIVPSYDFIPRTRSDLSKLKVTCLSIVGLCSLGFLGLKAFSTTGGGENGPSMTELISVEFEVYGRVQGVFFRKHTQSKGKQLGLTGWCRNTRTGTVEGVMEGPRGKVDQMLVFMLNNVEKIR